MDDPDRFPIGRFRRRPTPLDAATRREFITAIAEAPVAVRALVGPLSDAELDLRYRDGGWTVRQVVHHLPDSHMNAYIRIKMALTEDVPTIKSYEEDRWAELADNATPVWVSLDLLDALHRRWVGLLDTLNDAGFTTTYLHPSSGRMSIDDALALYAWHGRHHTAHIQRALQRASVS